MSEKRYVKRLIRWKGEPREVRLRNMKSLSPAPSGSLEVGEFVDLELAFPKGRVVLLAANNVGPVVLTPNQCRVLIAELESRIRNAESVR